MVFPFSCLAETNKKLTNSLAASMLTTIKGWLHSREWTVWADAER
jgi:hypothetical protein